MTGELRAKYWSRNKLYLLILLSIWFIVSYGCAVLYVDKLDTIKVGGFKLGFWFAQQGSIYIFVIIIFTYTWLMNRLDRECDVHEESVADLAKKSAAKAAAGGASASDETRIGGSANEKKG